MVGDVPGRSTKYRPEMCEEVIKLSEKGWPMVKIAHEWGLTEGNLQDWVYGKLSFSEQFSVAYKRGRGAYTAYVLDLIKDGMFDSKDRRMNATAAKALGTYARINMEERAILRSNINAPTHIERMNAVLDMSAKGELTSKQLKDMLESVAIAAKIEEMAFLEQRVEELEGIVAELTNEVSV